MFESELEDEQIKSLRAEITKRMDKVDDTGEGSMWKCTECGKQLKKKNKLEIHVETDLEGFSHICVHCDKAHKTRISLKTHINVHHKGAL